MFEFVFVCLKFDSQIIDFIPVSVTVRQRRQETATDGLLNMSVLSNAICHLTSLLPLTPPARRRVCGGSVGDRGDYRLNCCRPVGRVTETVIVDTCLGTNAAVHSSPLEMCGSWNFESASICMFWFKIRIRKLYILDDLSTGRLHLHCSVFTTLWIGSSPQANTLLELRNVVKQKNTS